MLCASMKMLFVTNMYPTVSQPAYGVFVKNIVDALKSTGIEVDVIAVSGRGATISHKICKYIWFYLRLLLIDVSRYDVVHISYPSHCYAPFIFRRKRIYTIVRVHGYDVIPRGPFKVISSWMTGMSLIRADMLVAPSQYFLDMVNEKYKHSARAVVYVSGGVDPDRFFPTGIKRTRYTIGYVGWMLPGKGPQVLIDALKGFDVESTRVLMIGGGPYLETVKRLARKYGLDHTVEFVGQVENSLLVDYYNEMDLFVFPTLEYESFGNVAIEAMACSVPVVGSRIGALPEYIEHGKNGYLFDPEQSDDLRECMLAHYRLSDDGRQVMRTHALETASKYEKAIQTEHFVRCLKDELAERASSL